MDVAVTEVLSVKPIGAHSTVAFDDGTWLRCTRDFANRSQFSRGQTIDPVFIERLRESASLDLAVCEAQRLARRQRYSRNEISKKMQTSELPPGVIHEALDMLEQHGELDDASIALQLTRHNLRLSLARDPDLTWAKFSKSHARRLVLRGFNSSVAFQAVRIAWAERE